MQFPSVQDQFHNLCLQHSIRSWIILDVFARRDALKSVGITLFKWFSRSDGSHQLIQATLCNQHNVFTRASIPRNGCNDYVWDLLFRNIWGNFCMPSQKLLWNQLLWLWAKSLKSKNSPERLTAPKMYSSFVRLPKICWWLGSNSKQQVHGQFGNHRGSSQRQFEAVITEGSFWIWVATTTWAEAERLLKAVWSIHQPLPWALSGMGWHFSISIRAAGRNMINWSPQPSLSSSRPVIVGRVFSTNVEQQPDGSHRTTICYALSHRDWTHLTALGSMIPTRSC